jgi:hypothetical protein
MSGNRVHLSVDAARALGERALREAAKETVP